MSCRLPGATDPTEFWDVTQRSEAKVSPLPDDRWTPEAVPDARYSTGGYIDQVTDFDWRAMRMLPREVRHMDPQHRLLLELAWEALEDAGVLFDHIAGSNTGVFVGLQWNDYYRLLARNWSRLKGYSVIGNDMAVAANRISYAFDLQGPSLVTSAACTSSIVALQSACQQLWLGEIDSALVGAAELILAPDSTLALASTGMLSRLGACLSFDRRGDGFVRGEGGVMLMLKRLSDVEESDRVYATVRGLSCLHNGTNEWIMAPSEERQRQVIRNACQAACVQPEELDYVEMHAPGKAKADALEARAVWSALGAGRDGSLSVGTAKPTIGHLGAASGAVALMRVATGLHRGMLPATIAPEERNPAVQEELEIAGPGTAWPSRGERLAGVTAVSLGGSVCHVVLSGADQETPRASSTGELVLPISARTPEALARTATRYSAWLRRADSETVISDLCATAAMRRQHHEHRLVVTGENARELADALDSRCQSTRGPTHILARRFEQGEEIDWTAVFGDAPKRVTSLPAHEWERVRVWPTWLTKELISTAPEQSAEPEAAVADAKTDSTAAAVPRDAREAIGS